MRSFKSSREYKMKIFKQQANICRALCRKRPLVQILCASIMAKETKAGKHTKKTAQQIITTMVFWIRPLELFWYNHLLQIELQSRLDQVQPGLKKSQGCKYHRPLGNPFKHHTALLVQKSSHGILFPSSTCGYGVVVLEIAQIRLLYHHNLMLMQKLT